MQLQSTISYGLCECGCGIPISQRSRTGQLRRFIRGHNSIPIAQRFWTKVHCTDTCWMWSGSRDRAGYGIIWRIVAGKSNRTAKAHRISWELHFGPIPEGLSVLHHCDNPPCVRPAHLYLGSQQDNMRDAVLRKRWKLKLTTQEALCVSQRYTDGQTTLSVLAKDYGVGTSTIFRTIRRMRLTS